MIRGHKLSRPVNCLKVIGNTITKNSAIVFYDSIPEYPLLSPPVRPRPVQEAPERNKIP
jgi:hypothetical protein